MQLIKIVSEYFEVFLFNFSVALLCGPEAIGRLDMLV